VIEPSKSGWVSYFLTYHILMLKRTFSTLHPYLVVVENGVWFRKPNPLYQAWENGAKSVKVPNQPIGTFPSQYKMTSPSFNDDRKSYYEKNGVSGGVADLERPETYLMGCCEKK
jgi:hypothetical protein